MKRKNISADGSSISTSGDADSMSERPTQDNNDNGVQPAPSQETSSFQQQMLVKLAEIAARLSEDRSGKDAELARCVVDLVQANERLTSTNERLTGQGNNPSLHVASRSTMDLPSNGTTIDILTTQMKNLQDSLQMASEQRDELKQSVTTLQQDKSDLLKNHSNLQKECTQLKADRQMASEQHDELKQSAIASQQEKADLLKDLSTLKDECAQLKSELSDVKKDCVSPIAGLKEEVSSRTIEAPVVQQVNQYVWKSSRDASVSVHHHEELLECPPMAAGVHKWTILLERYSPVFLTLGVASTVHTFNKNSYMVCQEGGWAYTSVGTAYHNGKCVKRNLPTLQKGSKVTFILDLTGEGTLSASVDDKSFHQLCSNMLSKVRAVNPAGGFVPAVSMSRSIDTVRFLGFESV